MGLASFQFPNGRNAHAPPRHRRSVPRRFVFNSQQFCSTVANDFRSQPYPLQRNSQGREGRAFLSDVGVTFAIYNQQDGGAPVWQETQNVTPDASGQYSVILGSITATGLPDDLFSQQEQRWLGVQVQGQAEQARVLLVSVPYAFKAHEAETLGGLPASAFVQAPPSNASGSGSRTRHRRERIEQRRERRQLIGDGGAEEGCSQTPTVRIPPWPVGPFLVDVPPAKDGNIYEDCNGNIGINNTSPSTQLDVNGDINAWLWYDITSAELPLLSIGWPANRVVAANENTWLGLYAGGQGSANTNDSGTGNTFVGHEAGLSNTGPTYFGSPEGSGNSFFGDSAGQANTTGYFNAFFGSDAGESNTGPTAKYPIGGSLNSFFGSFAGQNNTTGWYNAFFGYRAGYGNILGESNTCIGYQTCYTNDTTIGGLAGGFDTIVGRSAGFNNSGNYVTCVGTDACYNNTADNNTFVGYNSGSANTIGGYNTFVGSDTGVSNNNGGANTYLGRYAGYSNVSGNNNVLVGDSAGFSNTGGFNTFVGSSAGNQHPTGDGNTFVGNSAGVFALTGASNTYLGNGAGANNPNNGSNNTFVGFNAGVNNATGSNNVYLANSGPVPNESNTIRIGVLGLYGAAGTQLNTYVQGIYNAPPEIPGKVVCVGRDGKLWRSSAPTYKICAT